MKMGSHKVLIVGSGGREFSLAERFGADSSVSEVFVVPGNPAMQQLSQCTCLQGEVVELAQQYAVDLVVVGPEKPLVNGLADELRAIGIPVVGPSKSAAILEESKIASKQFMQAVGIPTARCTWHDGVESALQGLDDWSTTDGVVIKSDALAGGKGVVLCDSVSEAKKVVHAFMEDPTVTVKTDRILFEEKLYGVELSAFALCDGLTWRWLGVACDHKRVGDNDTGPNTGGMGTFIPEDFVTEHQRSEIERIFDLVVQGMADRGTPYQGILFAGLMINPSGVRPDSDDQVSVVEFNIRLGDPETQVLLPTLEGSIFDVFQAAALGTLDQCKAELQQSNYAVHVVAAAKGYPSIDGTPIPKGDTISVGDLPANTSVVCAGVSVRDKSLVTSGGRVLGVTGVGTTLAEARTLAYEAIAQVQFEGMHHRTDIASAQRMRF